MGCCTEHAQPKTVRKEFGAIQRLLSEYGGVGSFVLGVPRVCDGGVGSVRCAQSFADRAVLEQKAGKCGATQSARTRRMLQRAVERVRASIPEQIRDIHCDTTADDGGIHLNSASIYIAPLTNHQPHVSSSQIFTLFHFHFDYPFGIK